MLGSRLSLRSLAAGGFSPRGLAQTLFGFVVLSALWVTALTSLSARPTATAVMTEVGANLLNPYLSSAKVGVTESSYANLLQTATAHPNQSLALTFLKVGVPGKVIVGHSYSEGVRLIYGKVAEAYYDGGATNVLNLPPQLTQVLNTYGLFTSGQALQQLQQQHSIAGQQLPQVPQLPQLPPFLQPFFTFVGLSPTTLTAEGHDRMAGLLIWFWLAALATGGLALLLTSGPQRFSSVARTLLHGSWPVLAIFGIVWLIASRNEVGFKPYTGIYGLIAGAFVPVYGIAAVVGLLGWLAPKALGVFAGSGSQPAPAPARAPVAAAVPARRSESGYSAWPQGQQSVGRAPRPQGQQGMGGAPSPSPSPSPSPWSQGQPGQGVGGAAWPQAQQGRGGMGGSPWPDLQGRPDTEGILPREPYPSQGSYPPQAPMRDPYQPYPPQIPTREPYPPQAPSNEPYPPPGYRDPRQP